MGWSIRGFLSLALVLLAAAVSGAQQPSSAPQAPTPAPRAPFSKIPKVQHAPKLDDFLQNRPREAELAVSDFRQYIPRDGAPATESTAAYLSYDEKNLYVIFVCRDAPGEIRAHLSKRDDTEQDDAVGIYLDTFRDAHRAYFFSANPFGIQEDSIYTEGQGDDDSFDTLWYTEGRLTPDGYIVRFAIPFRSLRFPHAPEQTWGIALYRRIQRKSEQVYWPYVTQRVEGLTQQFAPVRGLEHISPGRNIQLIPYGLLAYDHFLDQSDVLNPASKNVFEHRGGLDAKFVARDALTFDVTLNPDFSQVESDDPQVTINQRFAVFFPEKRPFFIENAGFFQTPVNLFFSRQIADPQFGGRMTGKVGPWALGALVIDDREPGLNQPSGSPLDTRAVDGVFRVSREFSRQSQIGAFFSTRDFADSSNRVASLDARFKFSPNWVLNLQAAHSWTRQNASQLCALGNEHLEGGSYLANLAFTGRHFFYSSTLDDKTPGFCTELGFVNRVDIRKLTNFAGYLWRPEKHKVVIDFGPSITELVNWDHTGRVQDWEVDFVFQLDLTRQTTISFTRREAFEFLFAGSEFRKHASVPAIVTQPYKWLAFNAAFSTGTVENFFPAPTLSPPFPFLANSKRAVLGFTFRPESRFRLDQTYIFSRLGTRDGSTPAGFSPGTNIFNNHILRSKLNYQFTKELSLRLILDYNATLANPGLIDLQRNLGSFAGGPVPPTKSFTGDVLFTYLLHPGTAVYLGYSDAYGNLQLDNTFVPPVISRGAPATSTGRLFFVKVSYLFRY